MPEHDHAVGGFAGILVVGAAAASVLIYLIAATHPRRGGAWHPGRSVSWVAGTVVAAASVTGPFADAAGQDFRRQMVAHLALGMLAPLLLVIAAPVTLALRTLELTPARRLSRLLRSWPLRMLAHPVTATVLSAGGLCVIYGTPLFGAARHSTILMTAVMLHVLVSGYLFTAAILDVHPNPHPAGYPIRLTALAAAIAAHSVIAKRIYAEPPDSIGSVAAESGSQLMYYGGGAVHVMLIVLLIAGWRRQSERLRSRNALSIRSADIAYLYSNLNLEGPTPDGLRKLAVLGARNDGLSKQSQFRHHELNKRLGDEVVGQITIRA